MSVAQLLAQAKKVFMPTPIMGLVAEIESRNKPTSCWFKPTTDLQSQQMVASYIEAIKGDLGNGGYIFVKKSRAADVFRQLSEVGASYKAIRFENMADIADIIDIEHPAELWVIVEDDDQPYEVLASRFAVAETELRKKIVPALGLPVESDEATREALIKRKAMGVRVLMFIEMDYPSVKGFSVVISQLRALRVSTCTVTRINAYNDEVRKLFGQPARNLPEIKSMGVNSIQVFGSGPENFKECSEAFKSYLHREPLKAKQKGSETPEETLGLDLDQMRTATSLGLVVGFGDPAFVHVSR